MSLNVMVVWIPRTRGSVSLQVCTDEIRSWRQVPENVASSSVRNRKDGGGAQRRYDGTGHRLAAVINNQTVELAQARRRYRRGGLGDRPDVRLQYRELREGGWHAGNQTQHDPEGVPPGADLIHIGVLSPEGKPSGVVRRAEP